MQITVGQTIVFRGLPSRPSFDAGGARCVGQTTRNDGLPHGSTAESFVHPSCWLPWRLWLSPASPLRRSQLQLAGFQFEARLAGRPRRREHRATAEPAGPAGRRFRDEAGRVLPLSSFFADGKPVILALVYYRCPMLCTEILTGLESALKAVSLDAGKDFTSSASASTRKIPRSWPRPRSRCT